MNIQQLEYILAVDEHRHFARAADSCFVTQPTLSMMIQKLEDELDVRIFDRTRHPVAPTHIGRKIIDQARITLDCLRQVKEIVAEEKGLMQGTFRLGIIPTIAPYFLPLFLPRFVASYPGLQLVIHEMITSQSIENVIKGNIDGAILATPLNEARLTEHPLYYERFYAYVSDSMPCSEKAILGVDDIDGGRLWLLEEGHCFRSQILHYCNLRKKVPAGEEENIVYQAGSIETLIRMVDQHGGMTIIPEMAIRYLNPEQQQQLKPFADPMPVREISLVTRNDFIRQRMVDAFREETRQVLPSDMTSGKLRTFIVDIKRDGVPV